LFAASITPGPPPVITAYPAPTNEGLFLGRLCAAAVLVSLPVLIAGFAAQDKLVRGMSLGAVK
jgi:ABC-type glycerol-3-phosphate transport system permease component